MFAFSLTPFTITGPGNAGAGGDDGWILGTGAWRDSGTWIDTDLWKDS